MAFNRGVFFKKVYRRCKRQQDAAAVDLIVDSIDNLLLRGRFDECERVFAEAQPMQMSGAAIVSFLGITLAARMEIPSRVKFYDAAIEAIAYMRGSREAAERLLTKYK